MYAFRRALHTHRNVAQAQRETHRAPRSVRRCRWGFDGRNKVAALVVGRQPRVAAALRRSTGAQRSAPVRIARERYATPTATGHTTLTRFSNSLTHVSSSHCHRVPGRVRLVRLCVRLNLFRVEFLVGNFVISHLSEHERYYFQIFGQQKKIKIYNKFAFGLFSVSVLHSGELKRRWIPFITRLDFLRSE